MDTKHPIPENEMGRIIELSELDLDYSSIDENLDSLTRLAAKIAGTSISLINLIDTYTQWSVSAHGIDVDQMKRENSVCQYTIMDNDAFEVKDLAADTRFKDKFYVKDDPNLRYYFGVPLQTNNGYNIGALCVMDQQEKEISAEKVEMLTLIGQEIVERLLLIKQMDALRNIASDAKDTQRKLAHDIRGPLSGIIGLADIIREQGHSNKLEDVLQLINMMHKGGNSLLELADEILSNDKQSMANEAAKLAHLYTLSALKEVLEKLFTPQAMNKSVHLDIQTDANTEHVTFPRNKLIQIIGNLISNAIKFTPSNGHVWVNLSISLNQPKSLKVVVKDDGEGMDNHTLQEILNTRSNANTSHNGTMGEKGYGFGLMLVKHLIDKMGGSLAIYSEKTKGSAFEVSLPV